MFKITKNQKGMTLLETTIALGILMMGILASLALMLGSFNYIQSTEDEIVVVNLAREGLEVIRSIRNNNSNPPPPPYEDGYEPINIFSGDFDNKSYIVDSDVNITLNSSNIVNVETPGDVSQCSSGANTACNLYLTSAGRYTHDPSGNTKTVFSRLVTIKDDSSSLGDDEKIITSTVSWQVKGHVRTLTLEVRLTNWQTQ